MGPRYQTGDEVYFMGVFKIQKRTIDSSYQNNGVYYYRFAGGDREIGSYEGDLFPSPEEVAQALVDEFYDNQKETTR